MLHLIDRKPSRPVPRLKRSYRYGNGLKQKSNFEDRVVSSEIFEEQPVPIPLVEHHEELVSAVHFQICLHSDEDDLIAVECARGIKAHDVGGRGEDHVVLHDSASQGIGEGHGVSLNKRPSTKVEGKGPIREIDIGVIYYGGGNFFSILNIMNLLLLDTGPA